MMGVETLMLLLKLTAWCALPFALRPLLTRSSASMRHLLLTLALAGTLALPLLLVTAPVWQAPAWLRPSTLVPAVDTVVKPTPRPRIAERITTTESSHSVGLHAPTLVPDLGVGADSAVRTTAPASSPPQGQAPRGLSLHWLSWIWLAGAAWMTLRTGWAIVRASHLVRDATPISDPRASQAMAHARARLRSATQPELRQSQRSAVPFAWRGRSPVVVLPSCWRRWDDQRLTVVLVHELAHLSRRDALALWIGRAATALWWFHPLVRMLERWARQECEQAADDAVLLSGSRASEYAEHLLAISRALSPDRQARPFPSGVALMMSNSPDLKHRLLAILSADRPRRALTRRLAAGTSLAALTCAVVLAGARFAPVALAQEQEPDVEVDVEVEIDDHNHGHHDRGHGHGHRHDHGDSDSESRAGRAAWHKASDAHRHGRYDEAIAAFEAAAAEGYRPATATYNAACGMALSGRDDEALASLSRALELGLDDPELLAEDSDLDPLRADDRLQALIDQAFEDAGERRDPIEHYRYRNAYEALEVLRDTGSEDARAWSKIGTRLLTLRQLDIAAEALENAAQYAREAPATALYNLACAKALDDRPSEALEALERSIEAGYTDADHMRRDSDLATLRDEAEFERLTTLAEDLNFDRFQRGRHHPGKGKHGHRDHRYSTVTGGPAIDHFRGVVDEHPNLGIGWFNLAYALHYSERFGESIEAFDRARELGYRPATAAYNVACGLSMQNRVDDSLAALEQAIELGFTSGDLDHDSDLDNLRQDPRFRSLRLKMQLARHD